MNSFRLYLVYHFVRLLPDTKFFALKRFAYRWCGAAIGKNVRICSSVRIIGDSSLTIGNDVWIGHEVLIICSAPILIKQYVNIAPRVYIGTGTHEIDLTGPSIAGKGLSRPITIGEGVWLGANSQVISGTSIGNHSIVAMGAVVVKNVQEREMVAGVPAKRIKLL